MWEYCDGLLFADFMAGTHWVNLKADAEMLVVARVGLPTVVPQLRIFTNVIQFTAAMIPSMFNGNREIKLEKKHSFV